MIANCGVENDAHNEPEHDRCGQMHSEQEARHGDNQGGALGGHHVASPELGGCVVTSRYLTTDLVGCNPLRIMLRSGSRTDSVNGLSPQHVRRMFQDLVLERWANYENDKSVGWLKQDWESKIDPRFDSLPICVG